MYRVLANTIAALAFTAGAALTASATSVTPGGNFTAAGTAQFRLSGGNNGFQGICSVNVQGNLVASTGAFTITTAQFAPPCGTINTLPVDASIGLPVSGTSSVRTDGAWSFPVNFTATLGVNTGPGPRWGVSCDQSRPISLSWKKNGTAGAPATKLTTGGYQWFAQSTQTGATCEILLDLTLTPFETFH